MGSADIGVGDLLEYMSDSAPLDTLKSELSDYIKSWEDMVQTHYEEMDIYATTMRSLKEEVHQSEGRTVTIAHDQLCELCGKKVSSEPSYVFSCRHCFHEACIRDLVLPTLDAGRYERLISLESLRIQHQAAAALANSPKQRSAAESLAEVESEIDDILADDCP